MAKLTDDLEEFGSCSFIEEFFLVAVKTMRFLFSAVSAGKRRIKCKFKDITWNYENSKFVNITNLRDMVLKDITAVHAHNRKKIKRKNCCVVSEPETKE